MGSRGCIGVRCAKSKPVVRRRSGSLRASLVSGGMGGSQALPSRAAGNKVLRPNRERGGERMRSSSFDIFYAITQERCQARLLPSDSARVLGRSVRHELNLPGKE
jgi:hypothetical protein